MFNVKIYLKLCIYLSILTSMDKNSNEIEILKRTIEQLGHKIIILEERVVTLEREKYRTARSPSFLIGDPFTFLPEQG